MHSTLKILAFMDKQERSEIEILLQYFGYKPQSRGLPIIRQLTQFLGEVRQLDEADLFDLVDDAYDELLDLEQPWLMARLNMTDLTGVC